MPNTFAFMDKIHGRRILVTGAGGFLGPKVVKRLLDHGAIVTALIGPPGEPAEVLRHASLTNATGDIGDTAAIEKTMTGIEMVVHMAGPPSVMSSFEDPAGFTRVHVAGTAAVLDACRRAGVSRFVYMSSAEVYGRPQTSSVSEDYHIL